MRLIRGCCATAARFDHRHRPSDLLHRKNIWPVMLCFLHGASIDIEPVSALRWIGMTRSSAGRFFMELSLPANGVELTTRFASGQPDDSSRSRANRHLHSWDWGEVTPRQPWNAWLSLAD